MKSLIQWSATAGLLSGAIAGSLVAGAYSAQALPQDQILQKLRPIPVFTIADSKGSPLVVTSKDGKGGSVAGAFITQKDAQAFLDNLKTKDPNLAKGVQVVPISLAQVYQLNQTNRDKQDAVKFAFVPSVPQVQSATELLKKSGQNDAFNQTPLFVARGGPDKRYLTIVQGNQQIVPLFFKKEDLQAVIEESKKKQPDMANSIQIEVASLEWVMQAWQTKDDPLLKQIELVPPRESYEYIQTLIKQQGGQQRPQVAPASQSAPKK